eukprot:jgi/Chlat1/7901/Chrsp66S07207
MPEPPPPPPPPHTKVIVRHLPPTLTEEALLDVVNKKFTGRYTWVYLYQGKAGQKRQVLSRAYFNFKKPEDVLNFHAEFHGHLFVNTKGAQFRAEVEYAPFQKVPRSRPRRDPREGTYEKDSEYQAFESSLSAKVDMLPSAEVQLEKRDAERAALLAAGGTEPEVLTPLITYLRNKRANRDASRQQRGNASAAKVVKLAGKDTPITVKSRVEKPKDRGESAKPKPKALVASVSERAPKFEGEATSDKSTGGKPSKPPRPTSAKGPQAHVPLQPGAVSILTKSPTVSASQEPPQRMLLQRGQPAPQVAPSPPLPPPASPPQAKQQSQTRVAHAASPRDTRPTSAPGEQEGGRPLRNKDRPDRQVWTPRRRPDSAPIAPLLSAVAAAAASVSATPASNGAMQVKTILTKPKPSAKEQSQTVEAGIPEAFQKSEGGSQSGSPRSSNNSDAGSLQEGLPAHAVGEGRLDTSTSLRLSRQHLLLERCRWSICGVADLPRRIRASVLLHADSVAAGVHIKSTR